MLEWAIRLGGWLTLVVLGFLLGSEFGARHVVRLRLAYQHLIRNSVGGSKADYIIDNAEKCYREWR